MNYSEYRYGNAYFLCQWKAQGATEQRLHLSMATSRWQINELAVLIAVSSPWQKEDIDCSATVCLF